MAKWWCDMQNLKVYSKYRESDFTLKRTVCDSHQFNIWERKLNQWASISSLKLVLFGSGANHPPPLHSNVLASASATPFRWPDTQTETLSDTDVGINPRPSSPYTAHIYFPPPPHHHFSSTSIHIIASQSRSLDVSCFNQSVSLSISVNYVSSTSSQSVHQGQKLGNWINS